MRGNFNFAIRQTLISWPSIAAILTCSTLLLIDWLLVIWRLLCNIDYFVSTRASLDSNVTRKMLGFLQPKLPVLSLHSLSHDVYGLSTMLWSWILLLLKQFFSPFEAINCGKPGLPDHGSVSGLSTRYPHPITFTCDIGYEIQGPVVRRCQANGTWSGNKTSCKRK